MKEKDLVQMIKEDNWMMDVLREASRLNLPDWMIGAGFLRRVKSDFATSDSENNLVS